MDEKIAQNQERAALGGLPGIRNKVRAFVTVTLIPKDATSKTEVSLSPTSRVTNLRLFSSQTANISSLKPTSSFVVATLQKPPTSCPTTTVISTRKNKPFPPLSNSIPALLPRLSLKLSATLFNSNTTLPSGATPA
jgi:hypothetical protein